MVKKLFRRRKYFHSEVLPVNGPGENSVREMMEFIWKTKKN